MSDQVQVKVGQVWRDNDPRHAADNRLLTIVEIKVDFAYCTVEKGGKKARNTRVHLDRFRPTNSGYKLEKDVEAAASPPPVAPAAP